MKIVIDVNILIAALLKDSKTRNIIKSSGLEFYFPEVAFHKIIKYQDYMIKKSKISNEDFLLLVAKLFSHIHLVSRKEMIEYKIKAEGIMNDIDEEDAPFIAAALSLGDEAVIWSEDNHFEGQKEVHYIKTKDLENFISVSDKKSE